MTQKPSECIEQFLEFIQEAPAKHDKARQDISTADREVQDILHWLEFNYNADLGLCPVMKLIAAETDVRRRRRKAKKTAELMKPVSKWVSEHASTKNSLEQLLGEVRRIEKEIEGRRYSNKTDIIDRVLGNAEELMEDSGE